MPTKQFKNVIEWGAAIMYVYTCIFYPFKDIIGDIFGMYVKKLPDLSTRFKIPEPCLRLICCRLKIDYKENEG